ncbi:hypothetical protein [Aureispira sp. CCB-E]|uniref:hypothetical protein n=1 Tax=Aureispira sp. CCB-E TaxID=3051121 RepID=UPI002868753F|nr:hypothetical protein [Aureispira sp. CCB-E]WMX12122.1 hypothetical protein QP953_14940 [Aureispira sp. CCB-E]
MKDFRKNLKDGLTKTTNFVKKSSEDVVEKIKEGVEKIGQVGPAAKEKIVDVVNDVVAVLPLLEQAGYRTNEFKIGIALAPVIEVSFSKMAEVPEEKLEALKKEYENKKMFNMILSMLNTANSLSRKLEADDFSFHETVVEITVPPKVSLRYIHRKLEPVQINLLDDEV